MEAPVAALPSPHRWIIAQGPTRGGHKADIVIGGLRPQDFTRAVEKSLTKQRKTGGAPPEGEPEETGTAARLRGRKAGWSRTVYRRRYAKVRVSREWTTDENALRTLARLALVGAWKKVDQEAANASANLFGIEQPRDQEIVEALTQLPYEDIEATIAGLHRKPDAPVWTAGLLHRGVVSKLDLLFGPDTEGHRAVLFPASRTSFASSRATRVGRYLHRSRRRGRSERGQAAPGCQAPACRHFPRHDTPIQRSLTHSLTDPGVYVGFVGPLVPATGNRRSHKRPWSDDHPAG